MRTYKRTEKIDINAQSQNSQYNGFSFWALLRNGLFANKNSLRYLINKRINKMI